MRKSLNFIIFYTINFYLLKFKNLQIKQEILVYKDIDYIFL